MAIYHLHVGNISRAKGRSVVSAAAYIGANSLQDNRQKCAHDYRKKAGVEHLEIMAPSCAPSWAYDREKLWNAVDAREKRDNARTAKEVRIALPVELTNEQQAEVTHAFVKDAFVSLGLVAEFAIHREDEHNPHAHILLGTRVITPDGFTHKVRALDERTTVFDWRAKWAHQCNLALAKAGHEVRIDHRSFAVQGIDLEPTRHIGIPTRHARKGSQWQQDGCEQAPRKCRDKRTVTADAVAEHEAILAKNGDKILLRPESALEALALSRGTFTRRDIGSYLASHMDAERVSLALEKVVNCGEAFFLGRDFDDNDRYSTKSYMRTEAETRKLAVQLAMRNAHQVSWRSVQEPSFSRRMGTEQEAAYRYLTQESGDIAVVQGYAGSGKTYMLGAAREAWEAQGYRVIGAALAAKAAQGLEREAGIKAQTIASLIKSLEWDEKKKRRKATRYDRKTVLVIDEAGMVGTSDLHKLLSHAHRRGMKVALVGDTAQLQAVGAGAMMRAIAERIGEVVVSEVRRQNVGWQREATRMMGRGDMKTALELYEREGHFVGRETKLQAIDAMVKAWVDAKLKEPEKSSIMLAHERADVALANDKARRALIAAGVLNNGIEYKTDFGKRRFAEGDRLVFLKNDKELSVKNGESGTVQKVTSASIVVRLDGDDAREVKIAVSRYGHFDYGYAVTVHKSQGDTCDRVFVLGSAAYDSHLRYVALSRHREDVRLYWSEDVFKTTEGLIGRLGSASRRNNALDYAATHSLDAAVLGTFRLDRLEAAVAKQRQSEFVLELGQLSDEQLAERKRTLAEEAKGRIVKPSEFEHAGGRLKALSAALQRTQHDWEQAATELDRRKQDFIDRHNGAKQQQQQHAAATWLQHGPQTREGRDAHREMRRAFGAREAAISQMQRYHARSKTAQQAVEKASQHNRKLRLSRERLHLVEHEIEQRRVDVLQRQLDAVEFNLQQRSRMWHDAAKASSQADVDRAYVLDGQLKDTWMSLRAELTAASTVRYELSGMVATRGAWFAPIDAELPSDRSGLCAAVNEARAAYQTALEGWGLWRAEHSVAEAHTARRGEGNGAAVYRNLVVAERSHQRALRGYIEHITNEELDRAESSYLDAAKEWRAYKAAYPEEGREAYKGKGEAGRLWKAERSAQEQCARWESTSDWLLRRERHHIFPQRGAAGSWIHLAKCDENALELAEQWEQFKDEHGPNAVREARRGEGEGAGLYEQLRVAVAERQHARREFRVAKTEEQLAYLEHCSLVVGRELLEHLDDEKGIGRAILEQETEGELWQLGDLIDRKRADEAQLLDKLLRTEHIGFISHSEYQLSKGELADNRVLVGSWLAAERELVGKADVWDKVPADERSGARKGFGEHADTYVQYCEALSRRDVLRKHVERGVRAHQLGKLEKKHFEAFLTANRYSAPEHAEAEAAANRARLRSLALFDKCSACTEPLLHPQPEPTKQRQEIVNAAFHRASILWNKWRDEHSDADVMRARLGEQVYLGTARYDAYRRADIERQYVRDTVTHRAEHERPHEQHHAKEAELEAALERLLGKAKAREKLDRAAAAPPEKSTERQQSSSDAHELPEGATVLYVPYAQREEAKARGARWHKPSMTWYAPDGVDMAPFGQWRHNDAIARQPRQSFADVLREAGLEVDGEPILDGRWHRVPVEDGRRSKRDGAYIGNIDATTGTPYGYCKNHKTGDERRWSDTGGKPFTAERRTQIVKQKKESDLQRLSRQLERGKQLQRLWEKLPEASNDHPYLRKKGVCSYGLRQSEDGRLVMPLYDHNDHFWSQQTIDAQGEKRFGLGTRNTGCFFAIGEVKEAPRVLICEGYATGASIHRATELPVVVAVDAGNLQPVAEAIRKINPEAQIAIMADDDHHRKVNVGIEKATAAAEAVGGIVIAPQLTDSERRLKYTDFNDLERVRKFRGVAGLDTLRAEIWTRFAEQERVGLDLKSYLDRREAKRQADIKERASLDNPPAEQKSKQGNLERGGDGEKVKGKELQQTKSSGHIDYTSLSRAQLRELIEKQHQKILKGCGLKPKSRGRKDPGHGFSL